MSRRTLALAAALLVGIAACDDSPVMFTQPPRAPSSPTPGPSTGTVTGTVTEFTATGGRRAVPNLRLKVRTMGSEGNAVSGAELPDVVSDANGRYEIANVTELILFVTTAPESDYRFLCDSYPLMVRTQFRDLTVVHVSWSGDRLPPGMWSPGTSVHGTVSEHVDGVPKPVAGATVTLDSGTLEPPATTSRSGFYMVCSVTGTDASRTITARKDGFSSSTRQIVGGRDSRVDLVLTR